MRDVVIFGGTGFLGRHLAMWAKRQGASRIVLADIVPSRSPLPEPIQFELCDVRRPVELSASADTAVFNLAAIHRTPGHPDHEYLETNVAGARNVADFCERSRIDRLFFTSSISVYGPSEQLITEETVPNPATAYGDSKLEAERIQSDWATRAPGRKLVITRPGAVFGDGEGGNFTRLAKALASRRFVYPGRRDTVKACGYVDDLIESMWFAQRLASPTVTYNFGLPDPPTIEDVCLTFCRVGGFSRPRVVAPTPMLIAVAKALTALGASTFDPQRVMKLVRSTHVVPQILIDEGYQYRYDLEGAFEDWYAREPAGRFV